MPEREREREREREKCCTYAEEKGEKKSGAEQSTQ